LPSNTSTHFDVPALCEEALRADLGLVVSTNNPAGFRRILYAHMREAPHHRLHIFADPSSKSRFYLLKQPPSALDESTPPDATS